MELFERANGFVHVVTNYGHSSSDLQAAGISLLNAGITARDFLHHKLKALIIFHSYKSIGEYHLTLFAVDLYRVGLLLRILFQFQMHPLTVDLTVLTTLSGPDGPVSATQMMKWCFSDLRRLYNEDPGAVDGSDELPIESRSGLGSNIEINDGNELSVNADAMVGSMHNFGDLGDDAMNNSNPFLAAMYYVDACRIGQVLSERPDTRLMRGLSAHDGIAADEICASSTAHTLNGLALAYVKLEQWEAASLLGCKALGLAKKFFVSYDPGTDGWVSEVH
ncbi:hypothetical protein OEA41_008016 [Lepraria neglecta]|uniref:Uncharacterized protein n=1 Tax=Lepraria neglecta TaxID=209136 RepID=A0AAD9ZE58_9LECA|nr:hypothetical protein OEA41_008016 [Lepraria neglecta]